METSQIIRRAKARVNGRWSPFESFPFKSNLRHHFWWWEGKRNDCFWWFCTFWKKGRRERYELRPTRFRWKVVQNRQRNSETGQTEHTEKVGDWERKTWLWSTAINQDIDRFSPPSLCFYLIMREKRWNGDSGQHRKDSAGAVWLETCFMSMSSEITRNSWREATKNFLSVVHDIFALPIHRTGLSAPSFVPLHWFPLFHPVLMIRGWQSSWNTFLLLAMSHHCDPTSEIYRFPCMPNHWAGDMRMET